MNSAGRFISTISAAAFAACSLFFAPGALAQPASDALGELLVGQAAFGDWRTDAPLVRRKITELPAPYATRSASNFPRVIAKPPSATPKVPPGFQAELFASNLRDPRVVRVAPNGDIFIAESEPGRIRVLRAADGADSPSSNEVFASRLDQPFGIAFYPPGSDPQWIYVANTGSVVRYPYRNGDLKARGNAEVIVRDLPHAGGRSVQRGHITRDIAFSKDGRQMFVSVGSASNDGEGMGKRDAAAIARWEAQHGLGAAWGSETDRAAVLVFDPEGGNRRIFASGLRNCVGLAVHPMTGDLWCSTNERDDLGDDLVPDFMTRVHEGTRLLSWRPIKRVHAGLGLVGPVRNCRSRGPMDSAPHDEANHKSRRPPGRSERGKPCSPPPLFRLLLPPSALDCLRELFVLFRHLREAVLPQAFRPSPVPIRRLHGSILVQLLGAVVGRHFPPVRAENLNPDVLVMQPANQGMRHDASDLLNRARDRRILVQ